VSSFLRKEILQFIHVCDVVPDHRKRRYRLLEDWVHSLRDEYHDAAEEYWEAISHSVHHFWTCAWAWHGARGCLTACAQTIIMMGQSSWERATLCCAGSATAPVIRHGWTSGISVIFVLQEERSVRCSCETHGCTRVHSDRTCSQQKMNI